MLAPVEHGVLCRRIAAVVCVVVAAACLTATPAAAHSVKVFAEAEGTTVAGLVYFAGGGKARDMAVEAVGSDGVTARATTDNQGQFTLDLSATGTYRIVVDAGDGHRAECTVEVAAATAPATQSVEQLQQQLRDEGQQALERSKRLKPLRILIGLAVIAALGAALYRVRARRLRRPDRSD